MQFVNANAGVVYSKYCVQKERLRLARSLAHTMQHGSV